MKNKNTFFLPSRLISSNGNLHSLEYPLIMGILNVSPDSFFDGGMWKNEKSVLLQVEKMIAEGMNLLDVGAVSTRPGAAEVEASEEWKRLKNTLLFLRKKFPELIISVDTYRASIAQKAIDSGANMINDISGGEFDTEMWNVISMAKVPYVLTHTQGKPLVMQQSPKYENVVQEILAFFAQKINKAVEAGIKDIIIDPGFGFGKTVEQNYQLLGQLNTFQIFEKPVLVGISRKSMISKLLKISPEEALNGSSIAHTIALINHAQILRVHDVAEAVEVKKIICFMQKI